MKDTVLKLVTKALFERKLIEEGDRVLVAASGGKDSTLLAWALSAVRPAVKLNYTVGALHVSSDFCACCKKALLAQRFGEWGVSFTDIFVPIIGRLKEGRKMNCYWCSTQRRTELLKYAVEKGYNKLALGHHMDDILETFLMNLLDKGKAETMPALLQYDKYPVALIRPLCYVEERQVIESAGELELLSAVCTCPFGLNSRRRLMRERLAALTGGVPAVKRRMLGALL